MKLSRMKSETNFFTKSSDYNTIDKCGLNPEPYTRKSQHGFGHHHPFISV